METQAKKCHGFLAVEKLHLPLIEKRLFFKKLFYY